MIWKSFCESLLYVMADQFFLISMATTVMIGLFLGATLYDGLLSKLCKSLVSMGIYGFLMMATISTRVIPAISVDTFTKHHPFSGVATIICVTFFYFLGMTIGVMTTAYVHRNQKVHN